MKASNTLSYLSSLFGRFSALTEDEKLYVEQLYTQIMPRAFVRRSGCSDCYKDALIELQIKIKNTGMDKQKYRLRNGVLLFDHENKKYYTNSNLTDKIAKDYLKKHPEESRFFSEIPEVETVKDVDTEDETEIPEVETTSKSRKKNKQS